MIFTSPQWRRLRSWRWRRSVRLHGGEHLADETARSPGNQADRAARTADPDQLVCRSLMMRSKHDTQAGQHNIKLIIAVGQRLGIRGLPGQLHADFSSPFLAHLQKFGCDVGRNDLCAVLGCGNRGVAASGCDIEYYVARFDSRRIDQYRPEWAYQIGDDTWVAARCLHRSMLGLQGTVGLAQIGRRNVHQLRHSTFLL
jgi:hypothetical protein